MKKTFFDILKIIYFLKNDENKYKNENYTNDKINNKKTTIMKIK